MFLSEKDRERFEAKVKRGEPDTCWEWKAGLDSHGYGRFRVSGRQVGAHRIAWEMTFGPIPEGMFILHRCDNRKCVNHVHLFVGTQQDNMRDMWEKGRAQHAFGEKHSRAKLRATDIPLIRALGRNGISERKIAATFGVSSSVIHRVLNRERWSHVT